MVAPRARQGIFGVLMRMVIFRHAPWIETGRYPIWVSAFSFCARPGSGVAFIFLASGFTAIASEKDDTQGSHRTGAETQEYP